MRNRLMTFMIVLIWIMIVAAVVAAEYAGWNNDRQISAYLDGCTDGSRFYLIENTKDEGVLYVTDSDGQVQSVTGTDAIWEDSRFGRVAYAEGLYGVLTRTVTEDDRTNIQYRIASFDGSGSVLAMTPVLILSREGTLSGFTAERDGFYLTLVMDDGREAGAYFTERENLITLTGNEEEEKDILELELYELAACEKGRILIEARYGDGHFLFHKDDGSGAEAFTASEELFSAFDGRGLTKMQWFMFSPRRTVFYIGLLVTGCIVLAFISIALRNRSHTVYTIVLVEFVLLAITLTGSVWTLHIQEQTKDEETRRFGYYYIQTLAEETGTLWRLDFDGKDFYNKKDYYELRDRLSRFMEMDGIADIFMDICLVRSTDNRIMASASGHNRQSFDEVYAAKAGELILDLYEGARKAGMTMGVNGEHYQVLGVAASNGMYPKYLWIGITRQKDVSYSYLVYVKRIFLLCSLVSVVVLFFQDRELWRLARAMRYVADGGTRIAKRSAHGRDVNLMWNSLLEIDKMISRMNYTGYQIYESCYRFAPKNIEKLLGKNSITEVKGGDMVQVQGTVAVLSSAEAEGAGDQTAKQMNQFITLFEKYQEKSKGFFLSGQCDFSVMKLLFLEESPNAVESGALFLQKFYDEKSVRSFGTCIFLYCSRFTYGVAGTDIQSFPFLLSVEGREMERYAAWFRSMGLRMVVTESVRDRENLKKEILRYIGYICIFGISEKIRLYEILNAYPRHQRHLKQVTDIRFQQAIELFYQHDFYLARITFSDVLKDNPEDDMAKWYLFTCEKYLNEVRVEGDICRLRWEEGKRRE